MLRLPRRLLPLLLAPFALVTAPVGAGVGDLLVAPTRLVLDGRRGAEIILNNIGDDVATYRVSLEIRRMGADGRLSDVADPNAVEKAAQAMVLYAPRRVTLPPNQPQSIRISARAPQGLPDGEYRVHLQFRAIPKPKPIDASAEVKGVSIQITPIYGVTIPVIVRLGALQAKAGIANVRKVDDHGQPAVALDLSRSGSRSTFGEVRVLKAGVKDPIAVIAGIALYTEVGQRSVLVPVRAAMAASANGPVTVQYVESTPTGPVLLAETSAMLR